MLIVHTSHNDTIFRDDSRFLMSHVHIHIQESDGLML